MTSFVLFRSLLNYWLINNILILQYCFLILQVLTCMILVHRPLKYYILLLLEKTMTEYILKIVGDYQYGMIIINHQDFLNDDISLYTFLEDSFDDLIDRALGL